MGSTLDYSDIEIDSDYIYDSNAERAPSVGSDDDEEMDDDGTIGNFEQLLGAFGDVRTMAAGWLAEIEDLQEVQDGKYKQLLAPVARTVDNFLQKIIVNITKVEAHYEHYDRQLENTCVYVNPLEDDGFLECMTIYQNSIFAYHDVKNLDVQGVIERLQQQVQSH
jgi:hypothetical protein